MKDARSDHRGAGGDRPTGRERAAERDGFARHVVRRRSVQRAAAMALLVVAVLVAGSAVVNPLFGRVVHWRRIDVGAPIAILVLALAFRRRWL